MKGQILNSQSYSIWSYNGSGSLYEAFHSSEGRLISCEVTKSWEATLSMVLLMSIYDILARIMCPNLVPTRASCIPNLL
jgi:hypothetical protein